MLIRSISVFALVLCFTMAPARAVEVEEADAPVVVPCLPSVLLLSGNGILDGQKLISRRSITVVNPGRPTDELIPYRMTPHYFLSVAQVSEQGSVGVAVNGVLVTHSGSLTLLASGPQLDHLLRGLIRSARTLFELLDDKVTLLIGEGLDPRIAAAREVGAKVRSLDMWYDAHTINLIEREHRGEADYEKTFKPLVDFYRENRELLVAGSVFDIPYASNSVDVVICRRLLNNFPEDAFKRKALLEMIRVLKPGGKIRETWNELPRPFRERFLAEHSTLVGVDRHNLVKLAR